MKPNLQIIIVLLGFIMAITGIVLLYTDFKNGKVNYIPFLLFLGGVSIAFKPLIKTKHQSKKFKLPEINETEDQDSNEDS